VYCGGADADTWDHLIPLKKGGSNFPWNHVPACRSCNSQKNALDPEEWVRRAPAKVRVLLLEDLQRGRDLVDPQRYNRNPYEKVSLRALMDELIRVHEEHGKISSVLINQGLYSYSTFLKRIGNMAVLRQELSKALS